MTCGILLGLGDAELLQPLAGDPGAERVDDVARGKHRRHQRVERLGILHHPEQRRPLRPPDHLEAVELRVDQRPEDLPRPVGAEVGEEEPVAVGRARGSRRSPSAARTRRSRRAHRRPRSPPRRSRACSPSACRIAATAALDPLPALVAVHRVEAAADRRDARAVGQRRLELGDLAERRSSAARRGRRGRRASQPARPRRDHRRGRARSAAGARARRRAMRAREMRRALGSPSAPR